ncbi:MAG: alpha/beta hydrolase, partial [Paenibacillus sp.]|nr:alpha/beta hydrolase [Paenibacillus sp.]
MKTVDELSVLESFDYYERSMSAAISQIPPRLPWVEEDRQAIVQVLCQSLGVKKEWTPTIEAEVARVLPQDGFAVHFLTFRSWERTYGSAHLYVPDGAESGGVPLPFVLLCCGHGELSKLTPGYQAVARRLARQGAYVLIADNIGQGERVPMGHRDAVHPFACGMSVQGLIVMEALAWVEWAKHDARFDNNRLAAVGNSGGGTLTLMLAALCDSLAVLSSSGYPSTFEFIARKEKRHCHCNLIPGIVGQLEMWQLYSLFAPKPLYLFQGRDDNLIPEDLFYSVVRKVRTAYAKMGAADQFSFKSIPGPHSWSPESRYRLCAFLAKTLQLAPAADMADDTADCLDA